MVVSNIMTDNFLRLFVCHKVGGLLLLFYFC